MIMVEWTIIEIMKNDSIKKMVQEELFEIVGLNNIVEESYLPKLEYLEATIRKLCACTLLGVSPCSRQERLAHGNNLKFIPFGSGRRSCPRVPLAAKMQMYILASLLQSFNWSLLEGEEEHDLSHKNGIALKKMKPFDAIPSQRLPNVNLYM
ncbi:hypothetical protein OSB04_030009 [Centaurea solstitialis]|uniref:Cytochrome P450 n=1 Tax=Centaurea solstitialis TaxID=347529 RepID=A0AA38W6Q6_9ASTR|nr:hypothetical protein OSB04_030009 [Centaurea solstitialis]